MPTRRIFRPDSLKPYLPLMIEVILLVAVKQVWVLYAATLRGPLWLLGLLYLLCPFVLGVVTIGMILLAVSIRSIRRTRSLKPTLLLLFGVWMAFQLPLLDPPDTPEKQHFLRYRADYEAVVTLAQQDQLMADRTACGAGGYRVPVTLQHNVGCVYVDHSSATGLNIEFYPLEYPTHFVVYVEFDNAENPCGYDAYVEQTITVHWYVCERKWL